MAASLTGTWRRRLLECGARFAAALRFLSSPPRRAADAKVAAAHLSMPGPYRGRVAAASHPGCLVGGRPQAGPVCVMLERAMLDLTGAASWAEAWRIFFEPGDVVGIKVNSVGRPLCSSPEVLRAIIDGLGAAGVPRNDIFVYDRYRVEFLDAGIHRWLPDGVRWTCAVKRYDEVQQGIAGYDPEHYIDLPLVLPGQDPASLTARRSHAARFITQDVSKLVNLCVLKDHMAAGVTLSLKNLSHGLLNNVHRSHPTHSRVANDVFIPAAVSMPVIRSKAVLHILDGIRGMYHGGPAFRPQFTWEHRTLYAATDPVALDHVGLRVIDERRAAAGLAKVADALPDEFSPFARRQPEYIELAGALGLGEWNWDKIQVIHSEPKGG